MAQQEEHKQQYMNEEGEILEAGPPDEMAEALPEVGNDVEIGFEDEHADLMEHRMSAQQQNKLRDMFNVHASKKFEAAGGAN